MSGSRFFSAPLMAQLRALQEQCVQTGWQVTFAESCTGGLFGGLMTEAAGASRLFAVSYVVYSNRAKQQVLGVPAQLLRRHGAVSEACVRAMATGARRKAGADLALAVSGIAGPDGGSARCPVGTVWLAAASAHSASIACRKLAARGGRSAVREQTLRAGLRLLLEQFA